MILDHRKYNEIDYKKYKRVFIFGCSFSAYELWPGWAELLCMEMPDAEKFNYAQQGGGNLFISSMVAYADQKHKFCKDDLILLMWTTHCREDRYKETKWVTPGNIFTQGEISADFVKEWACVKGYIVRDLSLMALTKKYIENLSSDAIMLRAVDPDSDERMYMGPGNLDEVIDFYRDIVFDTADTLYSAVHNGRGGWINGHHYHWKEIMSDKLFADYHPNPKMYMEYLQKIGFELSPDTIKNIIEINSQLLEINELAAIKQWRRGLYKTLIPKYNHNMSIF